MFFKMQALFSIFFKFFYFFLLFLFYRHFCGVFYGYFIIPALEYCPEIHYTVEYIVL